MRLLNLIFNIILFIPLTLAAEDPSTTLFFPDVRNVEQAAGLIYSNDKTIQTAANWRFDDQRGGTFVTVKIPRSSNTKTSLVSGAVITNEKGLIMGPLTFIDLPDPRSLVPICKAVEVPAELASAKEAPLTSLVEIRERRVQLLIKQFEAAADRPLIDRLSKLERGFGFEYKEPLNLSLPPAELASRLDTLLHAIKRYKYFRSGG